MQKITSAWEARYLHDLLHENKIDYAERDVIYKTYNILLTIWDVWGLKSSIKETYISFNAV